jgi:Flp pilus assembly protein TadG
MVPIRHLRVRSERGAELVEFALVLPLLLVLIGGIIDFGFLFQRYEVVTNAAREGARLRSLAGYGGAAGLTATRNHVREYIRVGLNLTQAQLDAAVPNSAAGVNITTGTVAGVTPPVQTTIVAVTYQHNFIMLGPIMSLINATWSNQINVYGTSQMRLEMQAASAGS